jgi:large subunit ribosomal protein L24
MLGLKRSQRKKLKEAYPLHVKTGDTVLVLSGKDKGQTGIVRKVFSDDSKVLVEGLNKIKKATRPNPMAGIQGGLVEMEAPLFAAKVMLYCLSCSKPTRISLKTLDNGKKTRVCKKCSAQFDA